MSQSELEMKLKFRDLLASVQKGERVGERSFFVDADKAGLAEAVNELLDYVLDLSDRVRWLEANQHSCGGSEK